MMSCHFDPDDTTTFSAVCWVCGKPIEVAAAQDVEDALCLDHDPSASSRPSLESNLYELEVWLPGKRVSVIVEVHALSVGHLKHRLETARIDRWHLLNVARDPHLREPPPARRGGSPGGGPNRTIAQTDYPYCALWRTAQGSYAVTTAVGTSYYSARERGLALKHYQNEAGRTVSATG